MNNLKAIASTINSTFNYIFWGSIIGFEIAWVLMKINWVDMRFNTGLFFSLGMIAGLALAILKLKGKARTSTFSLYILAPLLALSGLVIFSILKNLHGASIVGPILIREGLNLKWVKLVVMQKIVLSYIIVGGLNSIFFIYKGSKTNKTG